MFNRGENYSYIVHGGYLMAAVRVLEIQFAIEEAVLPMNFLHNPMANKVFAQTSRYLITWLGRNANDIFKKGVHLLLFCRGSSPG